MARQPRIDLPGYAQHIWVRGNNRSALFSYDTERYFYLRVLDQALVKYGCDLHAYVLMTNHVHLLATGHQEGAISLMMQDVGRRFVPFINHQRDRTGTLFEGRFCSSLVQTDRYFLTCMRYIESNPVRAGMVMYPGDHPWSSFRANATGSPMRPLAPHSLYRALGKELTERGKAYVQLFNRPITDEDLTAIRQSVRENRVLGGPEFEQRLAEQLGRAVAPAPHGGKRPGQGRKRIKGSDLELTP